MGPLSGCDVDVLWPNGWMDQDETWHSGRPWLHPHCVIWGPSSPPKGHSCLFFGLCLWWPNGWNDQDATWYEGRPRPRRHWLDGGPATLPAKRGEDPQFSAHVYCGHGPSQLLLSSCNLFYNMYAFFPMFVK